MDFVKLDDVAFDRTIFEEVDATTAHLKSKATLRPIPAEDTVISEVCNLLLDSSHNRISGTVSNPR